MRQAPIVTNGKQTTLISTLQRGWLQAMDWGQLNPAPRKIFYGAYAIFFYGFLFFPSSKSHNNFFYVTLLLPSLIILKHLYPTFLKSNVFKLIITYLAYLILTNFWGVNVTLENVAEQIKHSLYVLAFLTASIVAETYYPEKKDRLLVNLTWISTVVFFINILLWYRTHAFPSTRLGNILGHMDNPILAGCFAGVVCLVLIENLKKQDGINIQMAIGGAFLINVIYIILSQSRTSMASLGPALIVLVAPYLRRKGRLVIITGLLAAIAVFFLQDALIAAISRNSYRVDTWHATLEKARASLWWGQGYFCETSVALKTYGLEVRHAHNVYLAALRDGGIIGLLLLLGVVSAAIWQACRQARSTNSHLTLALVVFGALAVFFDNDRLVDNPEEMWIFFWYPLSRVIAHDLLSAGFLRNAKAQKSTPFNTAARIA